MSFIGFCTQFPAQSGASAIPQYSHPQAHEHPFKLVRHPHPPPPPPETVQEQVDAPLPPILIGPLGLPSLAKISGSRVCQGLGFRASGDGRSWEV